MPINKLTRERKLFSERELYLHIAYTHFEFWSFNHSVDQFLHLRKMNEQFQCLSCFLCVCLNYFLTALQVQQRAKVFVKILHIWPNCLARHIHSFSHSTCPSFSCMRVCSVFVIEFGERSFITHHKSNSIQNTILGVVKNMCCAYLKWFEAHTHTTHTHAHKDADG